jgi:hypothetical protein
MVDDHPQPLSAEEDSPDPLEGQPQSFIIKIWLEKLNRESRLATWRGHITHVPSGQRSYVQDLDDIITFIVPFLWKMGIQLKWHWRVWHWFSRRQPQPPRVKART